jgi:hypothetical protein
MSWELEELESLSKSFRPGEVGWKGRTRYGFALVKIAHFCLNVNNITGEIYTTQVTRKYAFASTMSTNKGREICV